MLYVERIRQCAVQYDTLQEAVELEMDDEELRPLFEKVKEELKKES